MAVRKAETVYLGDASSVIRAAQAAQKANADYAAATKVSAEQIIAAQDRITAAGKAATDAALKQGDSASVAAAKAGRAALNQSRAVGESTAQQVAAYRTAADAAIRAAAEQEAAAKSAADAQAAASVRAKESAASAASAVGGFAKKAGETLIAAVTVTTWAAVKFQKNMELIHTQAGASTTELQRMSKAVLDLGLTTEQGPNKLAQALYPIESVGLRGADALAALAAASRGAAVGGSDLTETTHALAGVMVALHENGSKAAQTMAAIDAIVGVGKMTMQDFVDALSSGIVPTANAVGLSFRSLGAGLATLTDAGIPAEQAATKMRTILLMLAHEHTKEAVTNLKDIGLTADDLANAMRRPGNGLLDVLKLLHDHLEKLAPSQQVDILSSLAGGSRSAGTLITLIQNLDRVGMKYDAIGKLTGQFNQRVAAESETASHRIKVAWSIIQVAFIEAGTKILPIVSTILAAFAKFAQGIAKGTGLGGQFRTVIVDAFNAVKSVVSGVVGVVMDVVHAFEQNKTWAVALVGSLGGFVAILGTVQGAILAITIATRAWAIIQGILNVTMLANPLVAIGAAIAVVAGAVVMLELKTHFLEKAWAAVSSAATSAWNAIKSVAGPVVAWLVTAFNNVVHEIQSWRLAWAVVGAAVSLAESEVKLAFNAISLVVTTTFSVIKAVVEATMPLVGGLITQVLTAVKVAFQVTFAVVSSVVSTAFNVIKTIVTTFVGVLTGVVEVIRGILQGKWSEIWVGAKQIVSSIFGGIIGVVKDILNGLIQGILSVATAVLNAVKTIIEAPIKWLEGLWNTFYNIGKQVVQGFINGLVDAGGSLLSAGKNLAGSLISDIGGVLGINSPSKVFHQIGQWVVEGFVNGLMSQQDMISAGLNQAFVFPVDAAIAALTAKKAQLQAQWTAMDQAAQRSSLVAAIAAAQAQGSGGGTNVPAAALTGGVSGSSVRGSVAGFSASQNATARAVFRVLTAGGLSKAGAAGFLGNWAQESSLNVNERGGLLGQWLGSRLSALTSRFGPRPTASQQAMFALSELQGMPGLFAMLQHATDPRAAALAISQQYERPAAWAANNANRENQAAAFFSALMGGGSGRISVGGGKPSLSIASSYSNVQQAIAALKSFDEAAKRAAILAKIDIQITNLQRLKAFQDAVASLRTQVQSLAQSAAQAWQTAQHNAINNGPLSQQLAAMQAQDTATQNAQQLAQLQQAVVDAQFQVAHSAGAQKLTNQQALVQAQDALEAFQRQMIEQGLQDQINAQNTAVDNQVQSYQDALQKQLDALVTNLAQGKMNYAKWVADVNAILAGLNLGSATPTLSTDPNTEGAINAGPGPAGSTGSGRPNIVWGNRPGIGWGGKGYGGHRASGGPVLPGYVYTVGEHGPEDVVFGQRGTVMTASQTRHRRGGDVHIHGDLHVNSARHAQQVADRLAFRAMVGTP